MIRKHRCSTSPPDRSDVDPKTGQPISNSFKTWLFLKLETRAGVSGLLGYVRSLSEKPVKYSIRQFMPLFLRPVFQRLKQGLGRQAGWKDLKSTLRTGGRIIISFLPDIEVPDRNEKLRSCMDIITH